MSADKQNEVTLFGVNYDDHRDCLADDDQTDAGCICDHCGGDGWIDYFDGDGGDWGEDCPSEENHPIICRACRGTGVIL